MKKYWNVFLLVALMALSACTINNPSTSSTSNNDNTSQISTSNSEETSTSESTSSTTTSEVDEVEAYYQDVDTSLSGEAFLKELQDLNAKMRVRTVGYSNMGSYFLKTDGDPDNPGNLIGFYSGDSAYFSGSWTTFNREHVWPNSRGGSAVENDIHVIRPTIQSQNGDRGNSFFVEGKSSSKGGWDPAMESWGDEKYRGIVARIVFYCVVANPNFELVDKDNVSSGESNYKRSMGKLSDLLEWNDTYSIDWTETQRNDAAQDIQGNRNPFIDHPEWVNKIWG